MKKSDFTGWRDVFSFTFTQTVKQKAYGIFLVIFSIVALLYSPFMTLLNQYKELKDEKTPMSEVVVFDESGLAIDYSDVFSSKKYKDITVSTKPSEEFDAYEKQMEEVADDRMLIKITFNPKEERYNMLFVQGKKVEISELDKFDFSNEFCDFFEKARLEALDISAEQRAFLCTEIVKEVKTLSQTGTVVDKEKDSITLNDYMIMLFLLMICMLLININGNQIAVSIVTEKSSRVLEYLVLNVRPLALIVGKLLASIVTSTLQIFAVGFCYAASPFVSSLITPHLSKWLFGIVESAETSTTVADETLANYVQMMYGIKMEYIILAILFLLLGIVFFGIIAGLLGASVSKMDEMQDAMSLFQVLLIAGCYADMALCVMLIAEKSSPILSNILSICPITSPFLVPGSMLLGKMSMPLILASFAAMLIVIVLVFMLTANVYEALIFYNGKALKMKDIITLASAKKKSVEKGEVKDE